MKNESFKAQTEMERRKKLDVVLRQLTGDRLTMAERRMIGEAIGYRRQYSLRLCRSPRAFLHRTAPNDGVTCIQTIFGSLEDQPETPAAALVHQSDAHIVYIYLPVKKEELAI